MLPHNSCIGKISLPTNSVGRIQTPLEEEPKPPKSTKENAKDEPTKRESKSKPQTSRRLKRPDPLSTKDPLVTALSKNARDYLASIQITTAAQLLMARTTDVAESLPRWRKEKGMAELKGRTGALATISVWKRKVRKHAAVVGATTLSQLNIGTNANPEYWSEFKPGSNK